LSKNLLENPKAKAMNRRLRPMDADKDLKALNPYPLSASIGFDRRLNFLGLGLCVSVVKETLYV